MIGDAMMMHEKSKLGSNCHNIPGTVSLSIFEVFDEREELHFVWPSLVLYDL